MARRSTEVLKSLLVPGFRQHGALTLQRVMQVIGMNNGSVAVPIIQVKTLNLHHEPLRI